ncbi:BTAD domain-containing putative transcriptional regulator [Actinomadura sp. 9N407]|uniref:AfsR/SARP family transcriptional regulator n=1 Tax=Actinomadura sp. 9N407 TaxID=3375154 RepID=UPI0037A5C37F
MFQILGPLRAEGRHGGQVDLGGTRARLVLAALLLEPDRVVSVDRLVEAVWDERPPASARTQIAIAVSGLRRAFRDAGCAHQVIETVRPGYRIPSHAGSLDARTAEEQVVRARRAAKVGHMREAAELFHGVLALWHGPVLAGLDRTLIAAGALRWEELWLTVTEEAAEVDLALGRHHELIGALIEPVAAHPFRERMRALLMTALVRAGRQGEAIGAYRDGRRILAEELGVEPGHELRELYEAILRDDPAMYVRAVSPTPPKPATSTQRSSPGSLRSRTCTGAVPGSRRPYRRRGSGGPRRPGCPGC